MVAPAEAAIDILRRWMRFSGVSLRQSTKGLRSFKQTSAARLTKLSLIPEAIRPSGPFAYSEEHRVVHPDGSIRWVYVKGRANFEGERLTSFDGTVADITERKRSEELIRESEQRLRFILDSMPQKVFTATSKGEVDYFNPVWMEFTGLSFGEIREWGWTQFIHPDDYPNRATNTRRRTTRTAR